MRLSFAFLLFITVISLDAFSIPIGELNGDTLKLKKTDYEYDPVVYDAVNRLNKAMKYTGQLHVGDSILPFKTMYTTSATVICEYCEEKNIIALSSYIQDVKQYYPNGMQFEYSQRKDLIQKYHLGDSIFKVYIPFNKTIFGVLSSERNIQSDKKSKNELIAEIVLDYNLNTAQINRIHNSQKNSNFFSLGPVVQVRLTSEEDGNGISVDQSSGNSFGGEFNFFFNPFNGFSSGNRLNLYLKTGIRFLYRSNKSEYQSSEDIGDYETFNLGQDLGQGNNGISADFELVDPRQEITSFNLSIPLGISKVLELSERSNIRLDLQAFYNIELNRTFENSYAYEITSLTNNFSPDEPVPQGYWEDALIGASIPSGRFVEEVELENLNYLSYGGGINFIQDLGRTTLALGISIEIVNYGLSEDLKEIGIPEIGLTEVYQESSISIFDNSTTSIAQPWQNSLLETNPIYFGINASIIF